MAYDNRKKFWFGTIQHSEFIETPLQGADSSPESWGVDGTLLSGGGYGFHSWSSHKRYTYEWASSSSREAAQKMKSYRDGTYGRGLIYFVDPTTYSTNILPARWADPSMALGDEGSPHVRDAIMTATPTSSPQVNDLPVTSVTYRLPSTLPEGFRGESEAVFLPIPEGFSLYLGATYSWSGLGGVYYTEQLTVGTGSTYPVQNAPNSSSQIIQGAPIDWKPGLAGVWVWIGKTIPGSGSVTVTSLIARLLKTTEQGTPKESALRRGPWIGGQGHSGCRFSGMPSYVTNSPINGGRIGYAASFVEVGDFLYG